MVDAPGSTSNEQIHRFPVATKRQMVDDPGSTSNEQIHRVAALAT
jgi:hypothetical protein